MTEPAPTREIYDEEPMRISKSQLKILGDFVGQATDREQAVPAYEDFMDRMKKISEAELIDSKPGHIALTGAMLGALSRDPSARLNRAADLHSRVVDLAGLEHADNVEFGRFHQGLLEKPGNTLAISDRLANTIKYMNTREADGVDVNPMRIAVFSCAFAASLDQTQKTSLFADLQKAAV